MKYPTCSASCHMSFAEFGYYSYLRSVSAKNNYVRQFSDRVDAFYFSGRGSSKDTCNGLRKSLARRGWIKWLDKEHRKGRF